MDLRAWYQHLPYSGEDLRTGGVMVAGIFREKSVSEDRKQGRLLYTNQLWSELT